MNNIELWVFDMNFTRLAIIDTFEEVSCDTFYQNHHELTVKLNGNKEYATLFLNDEDRIIVKSNDIYRGYYIETPQFYDENNPIIELRCRSLSVMTSWRIVQGQQRFVGNIEDAIKYFVRMNAIDPADTKRIIPNLVLGENQGIDITVDETYTNRDLDVAIWEMCKKYDIGFEILINHDAKKYVVNTFRGADRSTLQNENPHVIFAKAFDNVNKQSYVDDKGNYRSTAYVKAQDRIINVNNDAQGFARREIFVDAESISKTYKNESGVDVTMTEAEYNETLRATGSSELAERQRIRTFESEVDALSQNVYDADYFIGDIVTNRNDELGIVTHSRVVTARETWSKSGYSLSLEFGTSIPTLLDKIKREVKK